MREGRSTASSDQNQHAVELLACAAPILGWRVTPTPHAEGMGDFVPQTGSQERIAPTPHTPTRKLLKPAQEEGPSAPIRELYALNGLFCPPLI